MVSGRNEVSSGDKAGAINDLFAAVQFVAWCTVEPVDRHTPLPDPGREPGARILRQQLRQRLIEPQPGAFRRHRKTMRVRGR